MASKEKMEDYLDREVMGSIPAAARGLTILPLKLGIVGSCKKWPLIVRVWLEGPGKLISICFAESHVWDLVVKVLALF